MPGREHDAVFFDVGGTLWWAEPSGDEIWARALKDHGYDFPVEDVVRRMGVRGPESNRLDIVRALQDTATGMNAPLPRTPEEQEDYFRRFDMMVLERLGLPPDEEIVKTVFRRFREDMSTHVYDDARDALEGLRAMGIRLGVISNATHGLPVRLRDVGLARHFEAITYSFETGVEKPDPRIFRTALQRLGVRAERAVHVGDAYEADVLGARGAGITPILIARGTPSPTVDCKVVRSLLEVADHL